MRKANAVGTQGAARDGVNQCAVNLVEIVFALVAFVAIGRAWSNTSVLYNLTIARRRFPALVKILNHSKPSEPTSFAYWVPTLPELYEAHDVAVVVAYDDLRWVGKNGN